MRVPLPRGRAWHTLDLDSIVWESANVAVPRPDEAVAASLQSFIDSHATWVIERCYGELVRAASVHCTLLVFLNPGIDACLANNLRRPWEPHKQASLELQNSMLDQLQEWVANYSFTITGAIVLSAIPEFVFGRYRRNKHDEL